MREGVSVSLVEAMASGCLCIVSDIQDNKEIIQDGHNGILFTTDDGEDLADALRRALSQPPPILSSISARARLYVEKRYSLEAVTDSVRRVMTRVQINAPSEGEKITHEKPVKTL